MKVTAIYAPESREKELFKWAVRSLWETRKSRQNRPPGFYEPV